MHTSNEKNIENLAIKPKQLWVSRSLISLQIGLVSQKKLGKLLRFIIIYVTDIITNKLCLGCNFDHFHLGNLGNFVYFYNTKPHRFCLNFSS